jgi:hypothetical protein
VTQYECAVGQGAASIEAYPQYGWLGCPDVMCDPSNSSPPRDIKETSRIANDGVQRVEHSAWRFAIYLRWERTIHGPIIYPDNPARKCRSFTG